MLVRPLVLVAATLARSITYTNQRYRFHFTLPNFWRGYKVLTSRTWHGNVLCPDGKRTIRQVHGPAIVLRSSDGTEPAPTKTFPSTSSPTPSGLSSKRTVSAWVPLQSHFQI